MGRKRLEVQKILISTRVHPDVKSALDALADNGGRNVSRVVERIVSDSRQVKKAIKERTGK